MRKFIVALILGLMSVVGLSARENSPWREIQTVIILQSVQIHTGVTKSGNPKAWIELPEIGKVTVSPTSAEKFRSGGLSLNLSSGIVTILRLTSILYVRSREARPQSKVLPRMSTLWGYSGSPI